MLKHIFASGTYLEMCISKNRSGGIADEKISGNEKCFFNCDCDFALTDSRCSPILAEEQKPARD
jgi:hypothetical protein